MKLIQVILDYIWLMFFFIVILTFAKLSLKVVQVPSDLALKQISPGRSPHITYSCFVTLYVHANGSSRIRTSPCLSILAEALLAMEQMAQLEQNPTSSLNRQRIRKN